MRLKFPCFFKGGHVWRVSASNGEYRIECVECPTIHHTQKKALR